MSRDDRSAAQDPIVEAYRKPQLSDLLRRAIPPVAETFSGFEGPSDVYQQPSYQPANTPVREGFASSLGKLETIRQLRNQITMLERSGRRPDALQNLKAKLAALTGERPAFAATGPFVRAPIAR